MLDSNDITEISNLGNLPLRHLSLSDNNLSAVNGFTQLTPEDAEVMSAFEETFEEMEIAFQALDANQDGRLTGAEFRSGLKMIGVNVPAATVDKIIQMLDKGGDGSISSNAFLGYFRRAKPHSGGDPGIRELADLESINLAHNPVDSLEGLEGHPCLRVRRIYRNCRSLAFMRPDSFGRQGSAALCTNTVCSLSCAALTSIRANAPP